MLPLHQYFIDIHCHPTLKPYGNSFESKPGVQSTKLKDKTNLWYYDPPRFVDKVINNISSLTHFRQSDFSSSVFGEMGILFTCLYSPEQGFFNNELGPVLADYPLNVITGLGKSRIDYLQRNSNYFQDLENEYNFLLQNRDKVIELNGENTTYTVLSRYSDLLLHEKKATRVLYNVVTIEGAHCFYNNWDSKTCTTQNTDAEVLANVNAVKSWEYKPLYISLAHHFYNGLCGHAFSFENFVRKVLKQDYGSNTGISSLGFKVIHKLLENPNRILIDVKHMSYKSRTSYYELLSTDYAREIPIIVSHGNVNGYKDSNGNVTFSDAPNLFYRRDINFYDDELIQVAKSKGLFGIQLDERRIASNQEIWKVMGKIQRKKILFHWSKLVWNQIEHIAKVLDKAGLPAWNLACLGSDYDGIVNPIGGYWTAEDIKYLDDYLLMHANTFVKNNPLSQKSDPEEIIYKFRCGNALEFLRVNYDK